MMSKRRVRRKVVREVISGSTAKEVFPTRPRVTLLRASGLTVRPRRGATVDVSGEKNTGRGSYRILECGR
jgi:hypothetical protein